MRPPFSYAGGKQRIASRIIDVCHEHDHYVEPYAGGLAVLFAKSPSAMETVNDLDGRLVNFWHQLRENPERLAWVCAMTPHARNEFVTAREISSDPLEDARRVWVLISQGRGSRMTRTGWRHVVTRAAGKSLPGYLDGYLQRLIGCAERLRNVSLENRDALDVIRAYDAPGTCFYVDPPYTLDTRRGNLYVWEADTDHHVHLLDVVRGCAGQVVLSGYANPLYEAALGDWSRIEIAATGATGGSRVEVVWTNRPPAGLLVAS